MSTTVTAQLIPAHFVKPNALTISEALLEPGVYDLEYEDDDSDDEIILIVLAPKYGFTLTGTNDALEPIIAEDYKNREFTRRVENTYQLNLTFNIRP